MIPEIDIAPFLQVIDLALRTAFYTVVGVAVGAAIAAIAILIVGGEE